MVVSTSSMDERTSGHNETVGRLRFMPTLRISDQSLWDEFRPWASSACTKGSTGLTLTDARCSWPREHRQERGHFDRIYSSSQLKEKICIRI